MVNGSTKAAVVCAARAVFFTMRRRINGFLKLLALWAVLLRGQNPAEAFKPRGIRPRSVPSRLLHVHRFGQELLVVVLVAVQLALPPRGVADGLRVRPGAQAVVQVHEARHIAAVFSECEGRCSLQQTKALSFSQTMRKWPPHAADLSHKSWSSWAFVFRIHTRCGLFL